MADEETGEYHTASAGASATFPMACGALKKGGFVVIKGRPCKIVEYTTSKTGKHGHAKAHIVGIDIFTQKKLEELCPTTHNMDVPNVNREEYQVVDITPDGFINLLDSNNEEKNDLQLPDSDLGRQIKEQFEGGKDLVVSVIKSMGEEAIVSSKEDNK
eukprot:NODE_5342_length_688_cov_1123.511737_g4968_i0.p1 GENE.NODE_5342_length_688_cov_1123.511737_g4968_i0~~NODE_5342_length_688_cov_1123.511737_g4968_i0.p1  ORF type:complete len:158 (+),score=35.73 NODE_5342_length_688_cov_1123.511737_g4968_i0:82-555(+)